MFLIFVGSKSSFCRFRLQALSRIANTFIVAKIIVVASIAYDEQHCLRDYPDSDNNLFTSGFQQVSLAFREPRQI